MCLRGDLVPGGRNRIGARSILGFGTRLRRRIRHHRRGRRGRHHLRRMRRIFGRLQEFRMVSQFLLVISTLRLMIVLSMILISIGISANLSHAVWKGYI